nr:MAG TPA: hypothetical protein [Caudoviricetes sp.]
MQLGLRSLHFSACIKPRTSYNADEINQPRPIPCQASSA